ncbi:hypothetical protein WJX73_006162 [Symbiochloris irregularis]|uniref:Uncharacterized protein n=1 Tax=Symbiochloris irregularis TaxID=706552 RepID=A0AAW1NYQ8_9CHLO
MHYQSTTRRKHTGTAGVLPPLKIMGKYWRTRRHAQTGYPYLPAKVGGHIHVVKPKLRHQDANPFFIGLFLDPAHQRAQQEHTRHQTALAHTSPSLKRLNFVRAYGHFYSDKIASIYDSSRKRMPSALRPSLYAIEDRVSTVGSPLWWGLHIRSEQLLWFLDIKLDGMCELVNTWVRPKEGDLWHMAPEGDAAPPPQTFAELRQAYLQRIDEALDFLRTHGLAGTAKCAAAAVMNCLDEAQSLSLEAEADMVVQRVSDAWAGLAALPAVSKMLENAQPSVDYARSRYMEAHDAVVASQAYDKALKSAARLLQRMQGSPLLRSATQRLYSLVAPYADPTLDRITGSERYRDLVDHLKPVPDYAEPCCAASPPQPQAHLSCVAF